MYTQIGVVDTSHGLSRRGCAKFTFRVVAPPNLISFVRQNTSDNYFAWLKKKVQSSNSIFGRFASFRVLFVPLSLLRQTQHQRARIRGAKFNRHPLSFSPTRIIPDRCNAYLSFWWVLSCLVFLLHCAEYVFRVPWLDCSGVSNVPETCMQQTRDVYEAALESCKKKSCHCFILSTVLSVSFLIALRASLRELCS